MCCFYDPSARPLVTPICINRLRYGNNIYIYVNMGHLHAGGIFVSIGSLFGLTVQIKSQIC